MAVLPEMRADSIRSALLPGHQGTHGDPTALRHFPEGDTLKRVLDKRPPKGFGKRTDRVLNRSDKLIPFPRSPTVPGNSPVSCRRHGCGSRNFRWDNMGPSPWQQKKGKSFKGCALNYVQPCPHVAQLLAEQVLQLLPPPIGVETPLESLA